MMALDATGDEDRLCSSTSARLEGRSRSAMSLIDTMDLLGVPVQQACLGRAEGAAVGVVATGAQGGGARIQFHLQAWGVGEQELGQPGARLEQSTATSSSNASSSASR